MEDKITLDELENCIIPMFFYSKQRNDVLFSFPFFCEKMTGISWEKFILSRFYAPQDGFHKYDTYVMRFPFTPTPDYCGLSWYYFWREKTLYRIHWTGEFLFQKLTWKDDTLTVETMDAPKWVNHILKIRNDKELDIAG